MSVPRLKTPQASPLFEKMNLERIKECFETSESSQRAIDTSKRLMVEAEELIKDIKDKRKKRRRAA